MSDQNSITPYPDVSVVLQMVQEGAYAPLQTLRRYDPDSAPCPTIDEGRFYLDQQGSDWIIQL